jgi:Amt family ammonium transporter
MLTATALVLLMTMPGLAIYYSGMLRDKNVLACTMQVFTIACLVTFLWLVFGYSLSFAPAQNNGHRNEVYGNADRLWLRGMMTHTVHRMAPTIPEALFCAYQLTFAIITAGLVAGAYADRMKYHSMIIFIVFWHLIVYCPMAHSNWHPQGFLFQLGVLDFAGGNVVHVCSGVSGLAAVMVIGNRKGFGTERFEPHNILITFMGMSMLWVGWYGFNAGSAFGANERAAYALLATQIATSVSSLMWMLTEWGVRKQPSILGMINGAIAGLVCITPGAGFVDMNGAFFIGFFGGPLCYLGSMLKHYFGFDDALDAFGVHAVGGIIGGLAVAFFATDEVAQGGGWGDQEGNPIKGVYYGNLKVGGHTFAIQLVGILFSIGWSFCWTWCILQIIDKSIGLRVSEEDEIEGLDSSIHGESMGKKAIAEKDDGGKVFEGIEEGKLGSDLVK